MPERFSKQLNVYLCHDEDVSEMDRSQCFQLARTKFPPFRLIFPFSFRNCFQGQNHARHRRDFRNIFKIRFKLHSEEWVSTARNTVLYARVKMDFDLVLKCLEAIVRHNYLSTPIVSNQLYQLENNQAK